MNWLEEICEVLTNPKFKQIQGKLQLMSGDDIVGKCALGELRCAKNTVTDDANDYNNVIMKAYKVPDDLFRNLPTLQSDYIGSSDEGKGNNFENPRFESEFETDGITSYIWHLNDCGFTYPQIVTFLKTTFGDAV